MIDHLANLLEKSFVPVLGTAGIAGGLMLGSAGSDWGAWWDKGGIALVIVIMIFLTGRTFLPPFLDFVRKYLEGLETRNATNLETLEARNAEVQKRWEDRMDASQRLFVEELREERNSRDHHKTETIAAIKEQTGYVAKLVEQLGDRPCQMHVFPKTVNPKAIKNEDTQQP